MRDLTKGNLYKTFFIFALPAIFSGLLSQAHNIINTIIAGRFLGQDGIAAIGATSSLITLITCAFSGYSVGFSLYIAKLFGAREYDKIKESVYNICIFTGVLIITLSLALIILSGKIMTFLNVESAIMRQTQLYFGVYMSGFVFIAFNGIGNFTMQAFGDSLYPFVMSLISSILNICGNVFAVIVLKSGIEALAVSSIASSLVVDVLYFIKLKQYFRKLNMKRGFNWSLKSIVTSLGYSLPVLAQQIIMYTSDIMITPMINSMGVGITSAYSVVGRIKAMAEQTYCNSSKALANYAAQCIGAGKAENLGKGVRVGMVQGMVFLVPVVLLCLFCATPICGAFFPKGYTGEGIECSVLFVKVYMPFVFFNVINNLFHSFFRGIKAMGYLITITAVGSVSKYLFAFVLFPYYSIRGVYLAMVIAWALEMIVCLILYRMGKWKESSVEKIRSEVYGE